MGLILGALVGVVALILYEQAKKTAPVAAKSAAPSSGNSSSSGPQPSNPIASSPGMLTNTNPGVDNSALLPQFDSANQSSIIDLSQQPALTPNGWNCQNGSIPYYDPRTQLVYCVIPGASPQVNSDIITTQNAPIPWWEEGANILTVGTP